MSTSRMSRGLSAKLGALTIAASLGSGCAALESGASNSRPLRGVTPVYLGSNDFVIVNHRMDLDKYRCEVGPLMCTRRAIEWECSCRSGMGALGF